MSQLDLNILNAIIYNKKSSLIFAESLDERVFLPEYWTFAKHIVLYVKTFRDLPILKYFQEKFKKNEILLSNFSNTWEKIKNITYNHREFIHDIESIKLRYKLSQVKELKEKISIDNYDSAFKDINNALKNLNSLEGGTQVYDNLYLNEFIPLFIEKFNSKKNNPDIDCGIKTNYSYIDYATNGLRPADFLIIAGESGFGKSLFLNNIAIQMWLQNNELNNSNSPGKNIIYFSLEMPYDECFNRILSRLSGVPARRIENATLTKEEFFKVKESIDFIKNYPNKFKIVDMTDACANDIEAVLEESGECFDALFVDYLGIMNSNEKNNEADWFNQGKISYEVRRIARRHKIPVLSALQLNRKTTSKESSENIGLSRLARSGSIATHATHVIQIESRPDEHLLSDFSYHIIKNRKGPKGNGILYKNLACCALIDKEIENEENSLFEQYNNEDISEDIKDMEF